MDLVTGASRGELLEWINSKLHLRLTKIEDTASGAVACQIIDMIYPDVISMSKVNFAAKEPYEYTKNYKILQSTFQKCNISKNIDVERLIKGRPQDNLEFMQWLKKFYDQNVQTAQAVEYNPEERRAVSRGGKDSTLPVVLSPRTSIPSIPLASSKQIHLSSSTSSPSRANDYVIQPTSKRIKTTTLTFAPTIPKRLADMEHSMVELQQQLEEKEGEFQKQLLEIGNLQGERDFYNQKLVSIDELLLKSKANESTNISMLVDQITAILYSEAISTNE